MNVRATYTLSGRDIYVRLKRTLDRCESRSLDNPEDRAFVLQALLTALVKE